MYFSKSLMKTLTAGPSLNLSLSGLPLLTRGIWSQISAGLVLVFKSHAECKDSTECDHLPEHVPLPLGWMN